MGQRKFKLKNTSHKKLYSESFKRTVVQEFERGHFSKDELQRKYCIKGNSAVLNWCRKYGKFAYPKNGEITGRPMKDLQKQRIKSLEKALELSKLKIEAYEKLIEITEKEEGISILKKDAVKQLKSLRKDIQDE
jgi:transposase